MNAPIKLKAKDVKPTRLELLQKQDGKCAICKLDCPEDQAVLDHCHKGGQIRAVLHRGCNSLLGKAENNAPRYGLKLEQLIAFLQGASGYIDLHRINISGLIHPSHFTAEEKADRRKKKADKLKAKKKLEKQKLKDASKPKTPE